MKCFVRRIDERRHQMTGTEHFNIALKDQRSSVSKKGKIWQYTF